MAQLSPLNRSGVFHNLIAADNQAAIDRAHGRHRHIETVTRYLCPVCDDEHDDEDEAIECCASESDGQGPNHCPVCGQENNSPRGASDCCLWKDIDAVARWALAARVEAGENWSEVLQPLTS